MVHTYLVSLTLNFKHTSSKVRRPIVGTKVQNLASTRTALFSMVGVVIHCRMCSFIARSFCPAKLASFSEPKSTQCPRKTLYGGGLPQSWTKKSGNRSKGSYLGNVVPEVIFTKASDSDIGQDFGLVQHPASLICLATIPYTLCTCEICSYLALCRNQQ